MWCGFDRAHGELAERLERRWDTTSAGTEPAEPTSPAGERPLRANFVPLNRDGLRADVIPTIEVEYTFSAPWNI